MTEIKKKNVCSFRKMKREGEKIVMLTAYNAPMAQLAAESGVDMILVGDSVGMTNLGFENTVSVTMEHMLHHCAAVRRGAPNLFVVGDMPFLSYHLSVEQALTNAGRLIQEAQCDAVKLEVDMSHVDLVRTIVHAGIPVMAHLGLLPQSIKTSGTYKVVGRDEEAAQNLIETAKAFEKAGAFGLVLECVPAAVAKQITEAVSIPTIGIGAGIYCDGQVQVVHDILGLSAHLPKHAKQYADLGTEIRKAISAYSQDVKSRAFPGESNSF